MDLLKWDPDEAFPGGAPFIVAGNFPYNISSQILFRVLDWRDRVPECVGMFQKEVAERVAEGTTRLIRKVLVGILVRNVSCFSLLLTTWNTCSRCTEQAFDSPPTRPKSTKSGVSRPLATKHREEHVTELPHGITFAHFRRVVKAAFSQRRKTLRNSIKSGVV